MRNCAGQFETAAAGNSNAVQALMVMRQPSKLDKRIQVPRAAPDREDDENSRRIVPSSKIRNCSQREGRLVAAPKKPAKKAKAGASKASAEMKRIAFVEAFLSNGENATQAAITAGFAAHSAGQTGNKLLKHPQISALIASRRLEIVAGLELNTERLVREVARLAFSDARNIYHQDGTIKKLHELDDDTAAAVASYEVDDKGTIKYKFWDKNSAQERASKIIGAFERDNQQKTDVTVTEDNPTQAARKIAFALALGLKAAQSNTAG